MINKENKNSVLYIVIPAYNEQDTIESVINDWYKIIENHNGDGKSRLVIFNDGSKDDTFNIANKLKEKCSLLEVVDKKNSGHGATVLYAYKYALRMGANYIFQTDSDGQTDPKEFEKFWDYKDDCDMVIGHRNNRQDGISRIIVTKTLKRIIRMIFNVTVIDANTPFRLMKANVLAKYIDLIPNDFNLSNVVLTVIYTKKNLRVKYIPIAFKPRQGGVNSINISKIMTIGKNAISGFIEINKVLENK